ncbi:hypothetical protein [Sorangium sp. So ce1097]|uniref:hypothetical protein n=1 Tax=Sorangium sp. So ce1097 TaxID=3133330 RepID=UPI003F5FB0AC
MTGVDVAAEPTAIEKEAAMFPAGVLAVSFHATSRGQSVRAFRRGQDRACRL